jgi:hypothetical protein
VEGASPDAKRSVGTELATGGWREIEADGWSLGSVCSRDDDEAAAAEKVALITIILKERRSGFTTTKS